MPAQQQKKDPLVFVANLIGFSFIVFVLSALLMRFLGALLLSLLFKGATLQNPAEVPEWFLGVYNICIALCTLLPVYFILRKGGKKVHLRIPVGKGSLPILTLLPLFLGIMVIINTISSSIYSNMAQRFPVLPVAQASGMPETRLGLFLYFIAMCILPAFLEEQVFRGALQSLLRPWGSLFAILFTSIAFSFLHANLEQVISVFVLSIFLGCVAETAQSVVPCIILHFASNTVSFIVTLAQRNMKGETILAFVLWVVTVCMGLFVAALWAAHKKQLWKKCKVTLKNSKPKNQNSIFKRFLKARVFLTGVVFVTGYAALRLTVFS